MAESEKDAKKSKLPRKNTKKDSMRVSAAKNRAQAAKPRRVRRAAEAAGRSSSSFGRFMTKEIHVLPRKNEDGFFTKSRKATPGFIRSSWQELRQVTWPGRKETWRLVFAVFMFAIIMGAVIAVLDYGLEKILREVIL